MPLTSGGPSNFDALLTTTLQSRQPVIVDNIHKSTPTTMFLDMRGRKRPQDGGESILVPLLYAKHSGIQSFQGYGTIDVDPQEGITGAQYTWKEYAAPITISRRERRQNSGENALINLLDSKVQQAELSAADRINTDIVTSNSSNALNLQGFENFLSAAAVGSQSGTVGGIDKSAHSWWNNQYGTASDAFQTNGLNVMRTTYNAASQGADHPDLILTTQSAYENFERVLEARERYQTSTSTESGARIAEAGFEFLKFKGAFMFFDDACTADRMYLLNSRYITFIVDSESDWAAQPFITPNNQAASSSLLIFMGAMTMSNLSRQGLIAGVDTF